MENNEILKALLDRFDKVDNQISQLNQNVENRFSEVDKKFDEVNNRFNVFDKKFDEVNDRFNLVDKKFEEVHEIFDAKFSEADKKFDEAILRLANIEKNQQEDIKATLNLVNKKIDRITYDIDYLSEKTGKHDTKINSLEKRIQS